MHHIKSMTEKNAPTSRAISMAMQIRWYGAERIAQYGRSRATPSGKYLSRIAPADAIVIDFGIKNRVVSL